MQNLVKGCAHKNVIRVDPLAGCVSYEQRSGCIIFSFSGTPRVQAVQVEGLPPSFIGVKQAQQVRLDAWELKPDQNTSVQPQTAPISNRTHASAHFSSSVARQQPLRSSPALQLRHTLSLVLNATAACPVFGHRSSRAHYLQPPPRLGFKLSQRLLELASLQPSCYGNKQRLRLLCCSRPLSALAIRLASEDDREGGCSLQWRAVVCIIARCLAVSATQL
jgi:hypothetical protein